MDVNLHNLDIEMAKRTMKQYCSSWNELRYDEIRNKPYFIGKRKENSEIEVLCPLNCNKILTYNQLKTSIVDSGSTSVNLAIYSPDSTVVIYKAHMGLKPPVPIKDIESSSVLEDPDITVPGPLKKRKVDSDSIVDSSVIPVNLDKNETSSNTNSLQINLQPSSDSESCESDHED